ncbi:MAG: uroporphyrinogen decarboxylase family protein, partial [Bacteroidota bacterium]
KGQIAAGVDIVQIFDSWAGILHKDTYMEFAFPYIQRICEAIQEVPKIVFAKGAFYALEELAKLDCQVIGLDWQTQPSFALDRISEQALQGNLDPCLVYAPDKTIVEKTEALIRSFPRGRHIVNLGHGMYPDMQPEKLKLLVQTVKQFRYDS